MSEFIMMVGIPGSGKSTMADRISRVTGYPIIGSDRVRGELYGDEAIQGDPIEVFTKIVDDIMVHAKVGQSVIYDATSIKKKYRMQMIQRFRKYYDVMKAVIVAEPYEVCVERNACRDRVAPEYVLRRMYLQFEMPCYWEGFDAIELYTTHPNYYDGETLLDEMKTFQQFNKHHCATLGNHMLSALDHLSDKGFADPAICLATKIHDIGKPETQVFTDYAGNPTDDAHYYSQMNVGAYKSLLWSHRMYIPDQLRIEVAGLIQYHMQPYFNKTEQDNLRWERQVGKEFWDKVLILHEADLKAH